MTTFKLGATTKKAFLGIQPASPAMPRHTASMQLYLRSIEEVLQEILPCELFDGTLDTQSKEAAETAFLQLRHMLPIVIAAEPQKTPGMIVFTALCQGEYIQGLEKYLREMLSGWLIPGRQLPLPLQKSLTFRFQNAPDHLFYINRSHLEINEQTDLPAIKNNLERFISNLKINIMAVHQARQIQSRTDVSGEEQSLLIKKNLNTLMKTGSSSGAQEHMQDFLARLSGEKKLSEIKENIAYLMQRRPDAFDSDAFDSMHNLSLLYRGKFAAARDPMHISRIIGFQYLFHKHLERSVAACSSKRYFKLKLLRSKKEGDDKSTPFLGILTSFNFLHDNELFDISHLQEAINRTILGICYIKDSYITDRRSDKIRSFYIEIEKESKENFTPEEIKKLRDDLPQEFQTSIQKIINPIFMPRNEEELLRNIVLLSKQIRFVRDIPQVIISYNKQTAKEISFLVILVRLIRPESMPLKDDFSKSKGALKFVSEEVKIVDRLKKKYPKEANIFRVSLNKTPFFRKDYSLDLQKARQTVVSELAGVIGNFRDFNGGMIAKQNQTLYRLKKNFKELDTEAEFLLENFFYSIKPGIMQSILSPEILKDLFVLFEGQQRHDFGRAPFLITTQAHQKYFLVMVGATSDKFKEMISSAIAQLKIPSFDLTSCFLDVDHVVACGYIFRSTDLFQRSLFYTTVLHAMNRWKAESNAQPPILRLTEH